MSATEELLRRCREAYEERRYTDCVIAAGQIMSRADDLVAEAEACYYKGSVEETRRQMGFAVRSWSQGLAALEEAGLTSHRWYGQMSTALESAQSRPAVFLSYSSSEAELAGVVLEFLERQSVEVTTYKVDFRLGERVDLQILHSLEHVNAIVVILSERYLRRHYTRLELEQTRKRIEAWGATGLAPRLILIRADDTEMPSELRELSWLDAQHGLTNADLAELTRSVRGGVEEEDSV